MAGICMIYASIHHGNTKKAVAYIAPELQADVVDIMKEKEPDISKYDTLIFASGIYFNNIHKRILKLIDDNNFEGKKVLLLYTCGIRVMNYVKPVRRLLVQKGAEYRGDVSCRGYDTNGPFEKIGGIAKGHPSKMDMERMSRKIRQKIE